MERPYLAPEKRWKHLLWLAILFIVNLASTDLLMTFDRQTVDPNIFVGISALLVLVSYIVYICYLTYFSIILINSQWSDLKNELRKGKAKTKTTKCISHK